MMNPEQVSLEKIKKVREYINRSEKQNKLFEAPNKWLQITSSLSVLTDSTYAIDYFCTTDFPSELGGKYLFVYGFLQALFLQQDAINSISTALFDMKIDFKAEYPDAFAAREFRNDVVGHPTNRGDGKAYVYLVQLTMQKDFIEYHRYSPDLTQDSQSVAVDVSKAIDNTSRCVNDMLDKTIDKLDKEFRAYIDAHKERKMRKIFGTLNYACEKVLSNDIFKSTEYDSTKRMVKECEDELVRRYGSVDAVDSFAYTLEKIHTAYDLIDNSLSDVSYETRSKLEQCLQEYLFDRLQELADMASELDEYFENA